MQRKDQFDRARLWKAIDARMCADSLTYREAGKQIGIEGSTLWRFAYRPARIETIIKICAWLGKPIDSFVRK